MECKVRLRCTDVLKRGGKGPQGGIGLTDTSGTRVCRRFMTPVSGMSRPSRCAALLRGSREEI